MEEDCEGASLEPVTVSKLYQDRIYQYLKLFPDSHVPVGFLDACLSPAGVLSISMCDHIAHNSCINKYKATLHIHDDDISSGGISNRLFNCPVCRKKCNFTVPILSSVPQKPSQQTAPIANFPTSETHLDKVLRDYSNQYIKSEMNKVLTDAPVSTMLLSGNPIYQLSMILYYPVLFELMSNGNKLPSKSYTTQTEKISSFYNLCLNIRRFYLSTSAQEESSSVSNLFGDSFLELLAQLVLTDFSKNLEMVLDSLVLSTLKREIVKQLLFWTWQLSEDERKAWTNAPSNKRPSRSPSGGETVLSSIPLVMRLFEQAFIKNVSTSGGSESCDQLAFLQPSTSSANCAISAVIWSEKSLESYLQDQTKQFLMLSVLLKSKLLNRPLLGCSDRSSANTDDHLLSHFNINEKNLLDLSFDDANEVITDMFALLTEKSKKQRRLRLDECKDLVSWTSLKSEFRSPKLITLPDDYDTLYRMYRKRKCNSCNLTPVNLSVCLICADLICVQERCCRKRTRTAPSRSFGEDVGYWNEACAHAQSCGNGVGVVLMLTTSQVLVLFNHLAAIWGCLHLDSHGEEDKELRRGKPLFLSKERYEMLNDQWMKLKFDGAHIKWFSHANKL